MAISIETRDALNNRSMLAPAPQVGAGLTLRPLSLGSLELLKELKNPLAEGGDLSNGEIDTTALAQYIWVHAAPTDEVLEVIYEKPSQVARRVAAFGMQVSPNDLRAVTMALNSDTAAVEAASAVPEAPEDASPNAPAPL